MKIVVASLWLVANLLLPCKSPEELYLILCLFQGGGQWGLRGGAWVLTMFGLMQTSVFLTGTSRFESVVLGEVMTHPRLASVTLRYPII